MEYVNRALSEDCFPDIFRPTELNPASLDRTVLDEHCSDTGEFLEDIEQSLSDDFVYDENTRLLLAALKSSLSKIKTTKFVLSLSGGVDSMSLLVLLLKLRVDFVAVHIRHSSRLEDTAKELHWVQYVCSRLSVPLYYHHVEVSRPHATAGPSDLTRDQFEELTRQIRFAMYKRASGMAFPGQEKTAVLIGHHLDDIDENRIAELGKGNLINIDGMSEDDGMDTLGISVYRPLCRVTRKFQIRNFAIHQKIPHMKNSTPKWSKRGWIRDVLDDCSEEEGCKFLAQLEELGRLSRHIESCLRAAVDTWTTNRGIDSNWRLQLKSKSKNINVRTLVLRLGILDSVSDECMQYILEMARSATEFGEAWNAKVRQLCGHANRVGLSCPIQPIRSWPTDDILEFRTIIYARCFQTVFELIRGIMGIDKFISKKSVSQLVENLQQGKPWINWKINNLKTEISVVHLEDKILCILDPEDLSTVINDQFSGKREDLKKAVTNNIDRVVLVSSDYYDFAVILMYY